MPAHLLSIVGKSWRALGRNVRSQTTMIFCKNNSVHEPRYMALAISKIFRYMLSISYLTTTTLHNWPFKIYAFFLQPNSLQNPSAAI